MLPGAVSAPGGQLVQATDQYAGTLGARIVLVDDHEVRAVMTASWLKQMGWRDVFVLAASGNEKGWPAGAGARPAAAVELAIEARELVRAGGEERRPPWSIFRSARPIARAISPARGSRSARGLPQALAKIPMNGELVLTSEDGVLAGLAAGRRARPARYSARRQRRLAGRRPSALDRSPHGRRAARLVAEALRARRRHQEPR